jgi:hypothetical protein
VSGRVGDAQSANAKSAASGCLASAIIGLVLSSFALSALVPPCRTAFFRMSRAMFLQPEQTTAAHSGNPLPR